MWSARIATESILTLYHSVDFKPELHLAGSQVSGTVHIDLNEAQEDKLDNVQVKLRGGIHKCALRLVLACLCCLADC